jgi:hypothetical protein
LADNCRKKIAYKDRTFVWEQTLKKKGVRIQNGFIWLWIALRHGNQAFPVSNKA